MYKPLLLVISLDSLHLCLSFLQPSMLQAIAIDNLVLLSNTNCAYAEIAYNMVLSLHKFNVTNYLVIAEGESAHQYLIARNINAALSPAKHVESKVHDFNSRGWITFMSARPRYLLHVVSLGFSAAWIDSDAFFFKNPVPFLQGAADVILADDTGKRPDNGASVIYYCGCFLRFRPTPYSVRVLELWINHQEKNMGLNDQIVLNKKVIPKLMGPNQRLPPNLHILPQELFPSGRLFELLRGSSAPAWYHANWMLGKDKKLYELKAHGSWLVPGAQACSAQ